MEFSTWLLNRIRQLKLNFVNKKEDLVGKKIAVVGSGPAGMEAAIECAKRGATVTVYEKNLLLAVQQYWVVTVWTGCHYSGW